MYIYIPAGILCGMSLSHPTPKLCAACLSHLTVRRGRAPNPTTKGVLPASWAPGPGSAHPRYVKVA